MDGTARKHQQRGGGNTFTAVSAARFQQFAMTACFGRPNHEHQFPSIAQSEGQVQHLSCACRMVPSRDYWRRHQQRICKTKSEPRECWSEGMPTWSTALEANKRCIAQRDMAVRLQAVGQILHTPLNAAPTIRDWHTKGNVFGQTDTNRTGGSLGNQPANSAKQHRRI